MHSDHTYRDAPLIHSYESSPMYNIAMFYNIVVSIPNMGFACPKCVPKNVFSLHRWRGAEEYYESVQIPQCGGLLHSGERDTATVAGQFLSRACSVSTVWRTTVGLQARRLILGRIINERRNVVLNAPHIGPKSRPGTTMLDAFHVARLARKSCGHQTIVIG